MKTENMLWIGLAALLVFVIAFPVYGFTESQRMARAKVLLQESYVIDGIELYVTNCASCHGADGAGIGMIPGLNNPALAKAQADALTKTIARSIHGTAMASWHIDEGGLLTDFQVKKLVTLIQNADWAMVGRVAAVRGYVEPMKPAIENGLSFLETETEEDPHRCVACHEDPEMHADLFGINCARCHNTVAWVPAVLTRHDFALDHGGTGEVDCKTCHPANYQTYDCYGCHNDHQADEMQTAHEAEGILEFAACANCHPTGAAGEADRLRQTGSDLYGQATPAGKVSSMFQPQIFDISKLQQIIDDINE